MQFWNFKVEISATAGDLARQWYVWLSSTIPFGFVWFTQGFSGHLGRTWKV
jgi:hypothetical protein